MARENWTDDRLDERFDRVEGQISDLRIEMRTEIKDLRGEVKAQGEELRGKIKEQGNELRAEIAAAQAGLRQEIAGVEARVRTQASGYHAETQEDMRQLRGEMIALHRTLSRIGWSAGFAMVAAMISLLISYH